MGAKGQPHSMPIKERFEKKIKINAETGCWEWQACKDKDGYGKFSIKGKDIRAHRVSYMIYNGEISYMIC